MFMAILQTLLYKYQRNFAPRVNTNFTFFPFMASGFFHSPPDTAIVTFLPFGALATADSRSSNCPLPFFDT